MAIRGENIGTAYIRILADGNGFDRSVRDEMDDIDWDKYGRKANAEWREGWIEESSSSANQRKLREAISKPLARGDWLNNEFFRGTNWTRFRSGLQNEFGKAGEEAGKDLERRLLEGMSFDQLERELDNLTPLLKRKQLEADREINLARDRAMEEYWRELAEKAAEAQEREFKERLDRDRDLESHWENLAADWTRIWDEAQDENRRRDQQAFKERLDLDKQWELHLADLMRKERAAEEEQIRLQRLGAMQAAAMREDERRDLLAQVELQRWGAMQAAAIREDQKRDLEKLRIEMQLFNRESSQLLAGDRTTMGRSALLTKINEIRDGMKRLNYENAVWDDMLSDTDRKLLYLNPTLNSHRKSIGKVADVTGRAFGWGARNDFVNFAGSMVRGIINIGQVLPAVIQGFSRWGRSISNAATPMSKMGAIFGPIAKGAAGIAAGFAGLSYIIGPLVSLLSLAAGAAMALASSLAFAVVGGLGALAGAFAPVVAGIGVMVAAFQNAPKEAKVALRSIKKEFDGLGTAAGETVFSNITEQAERFKGVLIDAEPVVRDIGKAISRVGDYWLDAMEGRGFKAFQEAMGEFLPGAVEQLGKALGDAFGGMGGILRSLVPLTEEFLTWLQKSAKTFNDWANSRAGQRDLLSFWSQSSESIKAVGGFLGAARDLFNELVAAGRGAGDSLFGSMADKLNEWTTTIRNNPDILRDWYNSAESFGEAVGRVLLGLGQVLDALDSPASRAIITGAFEGLALVLGTLSDLLTGFAGLFGETGLAVLGFAGAVGGAALAVGKLRTVMTTLGVASFIGNMKTAETRMKSLAGAARGLAGVGGLLALNSAAKETDTGLSALKTTAGAALLGFSVGGPIGAALGAGAGALYSIYDAGKKAKEGFKEALPPLGEFADTLDQVTGAATRATRALALQKLERTDTIDQARQFGISARDLISASLGEEDAIKRVNTALNSNKSLLGGLTKGSVLADLAELQGEFGAAAGEALEAAGATMTWKEALAGIGDRKLRVEVKNIGMDMTMTELEKLNRKYDLTPKEIRTIVKATGMDLTNKELTALVKELTKVDETEANPKVGMDKTDFDKKRRDALFDVEELGKKRPVPRLDLNPSQFNVKNTDALNKLTKLGQQKPVPLVDLNKYAADNKFKALFGDIEKLDGKKPTPKADLNDKVSGKIADLTGKLTIFGQLRKDATVGINDQATGKIQTIKSMISSITGKTVTITTEYISTGSGKIPRTATGGLFNYPNVRLIGEAGPEAVVPLNRPLAQVDPAVRWLSAIAQGKIPEMARGGVVGGGKTINVGGIQVMSPASDPAMVAEQVVNRLAASGY